jgi:hypothetical protein
MNKSKATNTSLSEDQVARIKHRLYRGTPARNLAEEYGVGVETIRRIGRGDTWGWVPPSDGTAAPPPFDQDSSLSTLSKMLEDIQSVRQISDDLTKLKED